MHSPLAEVLWTARYDYQPHWKLERHRHNYFQMISFRSGEGRFFLEGREYRLRPGMLFLIKPRQLHGLSASSTVKTLDIKFVVCDARLKRGLLACAEFIMEEGASLSSLVEKVRWEGERRGLLFREMCRMYLVHLLILYIRSNRVRREGECGAEVESDEAAGRSSVSRRALEFIRLHYSEDVDERRIARSLGVSDRHLRQRFKETFGATPARYLVRFRLERAKEMIQYSDEALKIVAELTGFNSIHYFTRVFQEITGETPGAWRRRYHEGICKDICISPHFSNVILVTPEDGGAAKSA
jgi:AraC-like DNA-binding protein